MIDDPAYPLSPSTPPIRDSVPICSQHRLMFFRLFQTVLERLYSHSFDDERELIKGFVGAFCEMHPGLPGLAVVHKMPNSTGPYVTIAASQNKIDLTESDKPLRPFTGPDVEETTLSVPFAETTIFIDTSPGATTCGDSLGDFAALALYSALLHFHNARLLHEQVKRNSILPAQMVEYDKFASFGHMAARVVHELKNPLTAIITYASFLTKKLEFANVEADDIERLKRIGEAADRILQFTRNLSAYVRPNDEQPSLFSLEELLQRAFAYCEHLYVPLDATIEIRAREVPPIFGLRAQLTQVFVNLISNACHAISDSGRTGWIVVQTELVGDNSVAVSVSDNGIGIAPDMLKRVFEPFFTTKNDGRGTGLGLAIVKSIVETHGGTTSVESTLGEGTTFTIRIPANSEARTSTRI